MKVMKCNCQHGRDSINGVKGKNKIEFVWRKEFEKIESKRLKWKNKVKIMDFTKRDKNSIILRNIICENIIQNCKKKNL